MNLDLSILGDVIHKECNQKYFSYLLHCIQQEAEEIGIVFNQKKTNFEFKDLNQNVKRRLEIVFSICRIYYLHPKISRSRALDWVLDDIETGYPERFVYEIFDALSEEKVYLHYPNILDESPLEEKSFIDSRLETYFKINTDFSEIPLEKMDFDSFIAKLDKDFEIKKDDN
jgi:hypothetical protein